jgi:hypothetical protein
VEQEIHLLLLLHKEVLEEILLQQLLQMELAVAVVELQK